MAMAIEEDLDETRFERRLKDWNGGRGTPPVIYHLPPDAPKWRGDALRFFMITGKDPGYGIKHRSRAIAGCFEMPKKRSEYDSSYEDEEEEEEEEDERSVKWLKGLLDELQAYDVESIDVATVFHSDGYLVPFVRNVLSNKHACVRAKAAELITSMVQNRPTSQQLVIEANGLQLLLHNFTTDPDTTSRTKALGAISSLIWNNKSGITVFLQEDGYEALRNALNSGSSTTHNEVENLIGYLRRESRLYLKFGHDLEAQEARNSGQLGKNDDKPKQDNSKKEETIQA